MFWEKEKRPQDSTERSGDVLLFSCSPVLGELSRGREPWQLFPPLVQKSMASGDFQVQAFVISCPAHCHPTSTGFVFSPSTFHTSAAFANLFLLAAGMFEQPNTSPAIQRPHESTQRSPLTKPSSPALIGRLPQIPSHRPAIISTTTQRDAGMFSAVGCREPCRRPAQ